MSVGFSGEFLDFFSLRNRACDHCEVYFITEAVPLLHLLCTLQVKKHSSYLMTVEMSLVGSLCLLASTYKSPDGETIKKYGFFRGWTIWTLVMILSPFFLGILINN